MTIWHLRLTQTGFFWHLKKCLRLYNPLTVHNQKDNILGPLMIPGVIGISNRISQAASMLRLYFKFQTCDLVQHSNHQLKPLHFRTGAYQLFGFYFLVKPFKRLARSQKPTVSYCCSGLHMAIQYKYLYMVIFLYISMYHINMYIYSYLYIFIYV